MNEIHRSKLITNDGESCGGHRSILYLHIIVSISYILIIELWVGMVLYHYISGYKNSRPQNS